jgi:hypothetical protein
MWLQENKHERSGKLMLYDLCYVTARSSYHHKCHACKLSHPRCPTCMPCHQSKGGKPRRIRMWHVNFTWIHRPTRAPKPHQEHVYIRTHLRAHRTATLRKHTTSGAHLGSADPRISRTDDGSVDPELPHGACLLVLEAILSVVLWPINRRGGGSFINNTTYSSSLTFGF